MQKPNKSKGKGHTTTRKAAPKKPITKAWNEKGRIKIQANAHRTKVISCIGHQQKHWGNNEAKSAWVEWEAQIN